MNKLTLNFLVAYADIYNLQDQPVADVIEKTLDFLNSDDFMEGFMLQYEVVKHCGLMSEIKYLISSGYTFWEACWEWDIVEYREVFHTAMINSVIDHHLDLNW